MSIYEFICQECQNRFEVFSKSSNQDKIICPQCKSEKAEKIFSVFGFSSGNKFVSSSSQGMTCSSCGTKNCEICGIFV